jgi:hypothetical protein
LNFAFGPELRARASCTCLPQLVARQWWRTHALVGN